MCNEDKYYKIFQYLFDLQDIDGIDIMMKYKNLDEEKFNGIFLGKYYGSQDLMIYPTFAKFLLENYTISHNYKFINEILLKCAYFSYNNLFKYIVYNFNNIDLAYRDGKILEYILINNNFDLFHVIENMLFYIDINIIQDNLLKVLKNSSNCIGNKLVIKILENFPIELKLDYYYLGMSILDIDINNCVMKLYGEIVIPHNIYNKFFYHVQDNLTKIYPHICPPPENI